MSEPTATPTPWPKPIPIGTPDGLWEIVDVATFEREADALLCWQAVNERDELLATVKKAVRVTAELMASNAELLAKAQLLETLQHEYQAMIDAGPAMPRPLVEMLYRASCCKPTPEEAAKEPCSCVAAYIVEEVELWAAVKNKELLAKVESYRNPAVGDVEAQAAAWVATYRALVEAGMLSWFCESTKGRDRAVGYVGHLAEQNEALRAALERIAVVGNSMAVLLGPLARDDRDKIVANQLFSEWDAALALARGT